ncbi:hypothetical protein ABPG75_011522 [Micractinium tetrahymenae]
MADDVGLPKSSLQKAIKDLLPGEMRITGDASDLLVQCCNQFVHLVSTQANSVSEREKRSTINPADVVRALEELEFGEQYVEAVKAVWDEWKVDNKEHQHQKLVHRKSGLAAAGGMTQQQLIELQHKLFEEARAATLSGPLPSLSLDHLGLPALASSMPAGAEEPAAAAAQQPVQGQQPEQRPVQEQQQQQQQQQQAAQEPAAPAPAQAGQQSEQQQQQQQAPPTEGAPPAQQAELAAGAAGEGAQGAAGGGGDDLDDVDVGDVDSELV